MGAFREAYEKINAILKGKGGMDRPLNSEVISSIESEDSAFIYLLKAPTGYGKTSVSWALALGATKYSAIFNNVIHVLPLRSIIEDIQRRSKNYFWENFSAVKMMGVSEEIFHLYPFNITTVDTFIWDTIKLNTKKIRRIKERKEFGYDLLTQATILNSLVFFDEAHYIIEDEMMRGAFGVVLNFLFSLRVPIIVSSATMPKNHQEVFEWFAKRYGYTFKTFEPAPSDPYIEKERRKKLTVSLERIKPFESKGIVPKLEPSRNLIVLNSVKKAVSVYESLGERCAGDKLLLHGKMKPSHRIKVLEKLNQLQNKTFTLVCTQVVEAGVDLSSDNLITELAPPNQLIQRMGRVARREEDSARITIIDTGDSAPYSQSVIEGSLRWLEVNANALHPRLPESYQVFLDTVYKGTYEIKSSLDRHKNLLNLLLDLRTRSNEILQRVEEIAKSEGFLREFSLPVSIDDEIVLFSPREVEKLYEDGKIEVRGCYEEQKPNFYELAKSLAFGRKSVELTYTWDYDEERGVVIWE
ncbi:MAG: CRISPR-associated helicase Cas3' [Candidatus Bathyarchaeia archaeon]